MTTPEDTLIDDLFLDEPDEAGDDTEIAGPPWKIMIVDDEPGVHEVTRLALQGVTFDKRPLEFRSAYSGAEAREVIAQHPDTALILLDVVMESEHAGLDFARYVREDTGNSVVRIVLRTGQPGQAPERKVIVDYDINDYKEKTELTAAKLFTLIHASLRAYRDIITIESNKRGLAKIIDSSTDIFKLSSLEKFAEGVLEQISGLVSSAPGSLFLKSRPGVKPDGLAAAFDRNGWRRVAGTGRYAEDLDADTLLNTRYGALLERAKASRGIAFDEHALLAYFEDRLESRNLLLVDGLSRLGENEIALIEMYMRNVSIALENISLHDDLEQTQREIIYLLGESVETRSKETGGHVRRVAEVSHFLARAMGLSERDADMLRTASPLHDLGKIAIPDAILHKPDRLDDEERAVMNTHAEIGYNLLHHSRRATLQMASHIAHEHHERWDGKGYPQGKQGADIDVFARITAVADVYDALLARRSYKEPWSVERTVDYLRTEAGTQFDPQIVQLLLDNVDAINAILARFPDPEPDQVSGRASEATHKPFMLQS